LFYVVYRVSSAASTRSAHISFINFTSQSRDYWKYIKTPL
jgi:hypothetical protein